MFGSAPWGGIVWGGLPEMQMATRHGRTVGAGNYTAIVRMLLEQEQRLRESDFVAKLRILHELKKIERDHRMVEAKRRQEQIRTSLFSTLLAEV